MDSIFVLPFYGRSVHVSSAHDRKEQEKSDDVKRGLQHEPDFGRKKNRRYQENYQHNDHLFSPFLQSQYATATIQSQVEH